MTKSQERYARKGNAGREVAAGGPASHQPYLGVCTRAKTLALRRLHESPPETAAFSYLQLRSRRLVKHLPARSRGSAKNRLAVSPGSKIGESKGRGTGAVEANSGSVLTKRHALSKARTEVAEDGNLAGVEASYGENDPDLDADGGARETTPCSLIKESVAIATPCSTTRAIMFSAKNKKLASASSSIPSALEMEELFVGPEQILQQCFINKYNFDVVKDQPLPGRYEWLKLDS